MIILLLYRRLSSRSIVEAEVLAYEFCVFRGWLTGCTHSTLITCLSTLITMPGVKTHSRGILVRLETYF